MARVIFLDVDGVLHPFSATCHFTTACVESLKRLVWASGATLVLSSSWQHTPELKALLDRTLERWSLARCSYTTVHPHKSRGPTSRAAEIVKFVDEHPELCAGGWVALDDLDLLEGGGRVAEGSTATLCAQTLRSG